MFEILVWLLVKHFVCDFPLQSHPFLYAYKGKYGSPGGICHALIQGAGTLLVLMLIPTVDAATALQFAALDTFVHYHIDWAKMSINQKMGWQPTTNSRFWILLGFDQFLHHMTYVAIAYLIVSA